MLRIYEEVPRMGVNVGCMEFIVREKRLPCVGHILEAHVRVSFAISMHVVPFFAGGGLLHDRLRC